MALKLSDWRGNNVLITDDTGAPLLKLDAAGALLTPKGRARTAADDSAHEIASLSWLASSVAGWIDWHGLVESGLRLDNVHPQLRDLVSPLLAELLEGNGLLSDESARLQKKPSAP
jgi:hypothetical protein